MHDQMEALTTIHTNLQQRLSYLFLAQSISQCASNMNTQLRAPVERTQHSQIEQAALLSE
jgi:hypothetical protein